MTYTEVVKNIEKRIGKFKSKGNLRIKKFLEKIGSPEKNLKVIHVAGTNGKGSTVNFIKDILKEDYKVGSFVSPHLITYCDRIRIGDQEISQDDFAAIGEIIISKEPEIIEDYGDLNLFEFLTIMAIIYFDREKVDIAVLEVGMGGRADSTNIFTSREKLISIITSISMDHMEYLGNTIEEIADAKAGIITDHGLVVTTNKDQKILGVIDKEAEEKSAEIYYTKDLESEIIKSDLRGIDFKVKLGDWEEFSLTQIGDYQVENALGAIYALYLLNKKGILKISTEKIRERIKSSRWQGRMEIVLRDPLIILDGAHNFDGIKKLVESIENFKFKKLYLIMSILSDKEHKKMLEEISSYTDEVVFVNLDYKRGTSPEELKKEASDYGLKAEVMSVEDAINHYQEKYEDGDLILITGSLYFVSEARAEILKYDYRV
ncbi:MAG: folylpolyglutamate synthase/dihydrofolate synthase family protein [Peptoniphilus grossensis]|uniref:bifunctional folylpolyglutamate synthase/dihydrofolate synthase n=1 Tax=Peptoniphilus grossensis TaxID=1465756 RepID=UPI00290EA22F|nr:folylpolyglutamate synthase/dihydrofolate synthase family protein [Peptoniphilus grossensis]MDU7150813.1 folylpolyglutamate synthase/dihydrofolate synthase family protein [Peptoniphilus grossensis]